MKRRPRWSHVVISLGVIAAIAIAAPAIGLSKSIRKAIKNEVAKQLGSATGPAGADGTARAYASVGSNCSGPLPPACPFNHAKGVSSVVRFTTGVYCITVPGISPSSVPSTAAVDWGATSDPEGNASAMSSTDPLTPGCGSETFAVVTERHAAAGNSDYSNTVGFTIVIP